MMTKEQMVLVKQSWRLFSKIDATLIGGVFYDKLFADSPSLKRLFKTSMEEQSKKLVDMLSWIIWHLDTDRTTAEELSALAKRHVQYGVKPAHYKAVGDALLWTLKQGFGEEWNQETEEAWTACYDSLASAMLTAGKT